MLGVTTSTEPGGYLECDGASLATATYPELFAIIGYWYGGAGVNFNIPDFRGKFLRGWDHAAGNDPDAGSRTNRGDGTTGDNVGTQQVDAFESHTHAIVCYDEGVAAIDVAYGSGVARSDKATVATGGNETRPVNVNVMYCIKY